MEIRALAKAATDECEPDKEGTDECFAACCALDVALTRERLIAMCDVIDAAKAMRRHVHDGSQPGCNVCRDAKAFDAALARLEGI